jgi:hypothetical protein
MLIPPSAFRRDVHIALADPADASQTLVVEVVDPACAGAAQSPFLVTPTQVKLQHQALGALAGKTVAFAASGSTISHTVR